MTINSRPPGEPPDDRVEALVKEGKYGPAAEQARSNGDHARASQLFEKVWDWGNAARCAAEAGDMPRALRNAVDAKDDDLAAQYLTVLTEQGDGGKRSAAEVLAGRRRFAQAAALFEDISDLLRALDLYEQGHLDLDAARVLQALGRDADAGRKLERAIAQAATPEELAAAHLELGRILASRMRHEDAVRHLQEAIKSEGTSKTARRLLIVELAAMDLNQAARDALISARKEDPTLPADLDELIRRERPASPQTRGQTEIVGGRYRIGELLGTGGVGRVYQARDEVSGRTVAVKLFATAYARGHEGYERFVREARIASTLRHPNLVEAYDFSAEQGYLIMELMVGGSLRNRLASPMTPVAARRMLLDVLAGLELAHQRGIIHRDIKPANIFFDGRGTAKLGDFGVAHLLDLGQTQTGGLIGTLAYMSPEQITGSRLTITCDLYALGITMFEALTGRLPFLGPDFVAEHLGKAAPQPSAIKPELDGAWNHICARLLAKNPSERFESIDELRRAIGAIDENHQVSALLLPRAVPGAKTRPSGQRVSVAPPVAENEEAAPRYDFETPLGQTNNSTLSRAVDRALDRSIVLEHFDEIDDNTRARIYALADARSPFVQRALAFDEVAQTVVYEAPSGTPLSEWIQTHRLAPRAAARFLKRLARALASVHEAGSCHGAIGMETVLTDDHGFPTVMAAGLGVADATQTVEGDVQRCVGLIAELTSGPDAPASQNPIPGQRLMDALDIDLGSGDYAATISRLSRPRNGEELYALADAIELAVLTMLAMPKKSAPRLR